MKSSHDGYPHPMNDFVRDAAGGFSIFHTTLSHDQPQSAIQATVAPVIEQPKPTVSVTTTPPETVAESPAESTDSDEGAPTLPDHVPPH